MKFRYVICSDIRSHLDMCEDYILDDELSPPIMFYSRAHAHFALRGPKSRGEVIHCYRLALDGSDDLKGDETRFMSAEHCLIDGVATVRFTAGPIMKAAVRAFR